MQIITIPQINSNDDTCVLVEWLYENGQEVDEGALLATLETSKATIDLMSPGIGILQVRGNAGEEYAPGSEVALLFATAEERQAFLSRETADAHELPQKYILTQDAEALVREHHISDNQLASLGKKFVKKADILSLLENTDSKQQPVLTSRQQTVLQSKRTQSLVAQRVTLAHQTIPSAFAAIKIFCDPALQAITHYIEREGVIIGLLEVFLKEVGALSSLYPQFYQNHDQGEAVTTGIGVTMDVGTGLYIPVLKAVDTKSLEQIADELMEARLKALQKAFKDDDLSGGGLTISVHTEQDILLALPIIFPTQTAMLSLCSVQDELYFDDEGQVRRRQYITLGVTYDHRFINGAEAVQFLQEIKRRLESVSENNV
ncbi:2-oxo acid dehydrogenase subunit E2 [Tengunoibacter tsumagoiensis]|uniref:Dihydrolipoamide acetyltransferase component of pyruvate dehydrogenase complex n=1 Tax=Tengunoibacter tsumagoiensis TaxID=2014871 RepID=A0A402A9G6_9CHLR|nr:2-oxo acid dehydrogenase subunit E2 [Tengunoibacter tsumagoiensis]GCE15817.1 dihydrolipoamide acetyltransferase component of pyruvate dehydrogenase complex [Tengunoibacter tsumagoiensis]